VVLFEAEATTQEGRFDKASKPTMHSKSRLYDCWQKNNIGWRVVMYGMRWFVFIAASLQAEPHIEYMIIHNRTQSDEYVHVYWKDFLMLQKIRLPRAADNSRKASIKGIALSWQPVNQEKIALKQQIHGTSKKPGNRKHISSLIGFMQHNWSSVCLSAPSSHKTYPRVERSQG
jgi:hypothetical protein